MKTLKRSLGLILFGALLLANCSSSQIEKDAENLAEIACELRIMAMNLDEGDIHGLTEFTQKMAQFAEMSKEMEEKHNLKESDPEFERLIREALKETPCGDVELEDLFDFF